MKRLILLLFSTIISLAILAQNEAFVVEQKNGLADIFKVTENIRVKHEKDSVFIVYGDSVGESYTRTDIKRIRFNEEKVLVDSVERAALVALYKATDGDNWTNKTNWCSEKPILEWYGVERGSGSDLSLELRYNNLKGQLPSEFTNLINFTRINLAVNNLEGPILPDISRLKRLKNLALSRNNFCGGIPGSIGRLKELEYLYITYCSSLNGEIPKELGSLSQLRMLDLGWNQFSGEIPKELGSLSQLECLYLEFNQLSGEIPKELENLDNLKACDLRSNKLTGRIPPELGNMEKLSSLILTGNELTGSIPIELGNLKNLEYLMLGNPQLSGEIPRELGNLEKLRYLAISGTGISGEIPKELGNLEKLTDLNICQTSISGEIPKDLSNLSNLKALNLENNFLTGKLPSELGELTELRQLYLMGNQLEGEIPESFNNLKNLIFLDDNGYPKVFQAFFEFNRFSGKIPSLFLDNLVWKYEWSHFIAGNKYTLEEVYVPGPLFHVSDINDAILDSKEIYPNHKYTAIFHWATWCGYSIAYIQDLVRLYNKYRDFGFEIIGLATNEELSTVSNFIKDKGIEWPNFISTFSNRLDYFPSIAVGFGYPIGPTPEITLIDSNGRVVFSDLISDRYELSAFLEGKLGEGKKDEYYTSTDYSQDGKVKMLQTATKGDKAINIVLIGEGFVDKDMNDGGKYDLKMNEAMENFFAEQPITALREYFNVYAVKAVSPNAEFFNNSKHAINEDNNKAFEYAIKAVGENAERMMIGVIYNSEYAGRSVTSMYNGDGSFVAYIKESNSRVLSHEMGGHGLAQLLDEYVEPENTGKTLPDDMKALLDTYWEQFGIGANVDYHNNPSEVKWADFLTDERYAEEKSGLFEGSFLYTFGCYRPTANSMMRYGDGPFNAPGREAIYKHVMKYSNPSWQYIREDFVQFDKNNFNYEKELSKKMIKKIEQDKKVEHKIENNLPPKIINGGWKDINGNYCVGR